MTHYDYYRRQLEEAADEIERLQKAELNQQNKRLWEENYDLKKQVELLQQENKELRVEFAQRVLDISRMQGSTC